MPDLFNEAGSTVRLEFHGHDLAERIIQQEEGWSDLTGSLRAIDLENVLDRYGQYRKPPAGAQRPLNAIIKRRLQDLDWTSEARIFSAGENSGKWRMDFHQGGLGVEVSFNNEQYIPWILNRLMLARRDAAIDPRYRIRVGVLVVATERLKAWGKMDATCATFERVRDLWLPRLGHILTFPIMVVGLDAAQGTTIWPDDRSPFRGTTRGLRERGLAHMEAEEAAAGEVDVGDQPLELDLDEN